MNRSRPALIIVGMLIIVGVSTNNSVEATARTAGNLGFQTQVVADGDHAARPRSIQALSENRGRTEPVRPMGHC